MASLRGLGAGTHVLAVCQRPSRCCSAVSLRAPADDHAQPASMTLIAGPNDTRISRNRVNELAATRPMSSFERRLITTVPRRYPGAGRSVYSRVPPAGRVHEHEPRAAPARTTASNRDLAGGHAERAAATQAFYDEYGAVIGVPAEYHLEAERIFREHLLPRGDLTWRGHRVDPSGNRRSALLTVEGTNDDIYSPEQTQAAHELCTGIPSDRRQHHLQQGVGHYGSSAARAGSRRSIPGSARFIATQRLVGSGRRGLSGCRRADFRGEVLGSGCTQAGTAAVG